MIKYVEPFQAKIGNQYVVIQAEVDVDCFEEIHILDYQVSSTSGESFTMTDTIEDIIKNEFNAQQFFKEESENWDLFLEHSTPFGVM